MARLTEFWEKIKELWSAFSSHFPWIEANYQDLIVALIGFWLFVRIGPWFFRQAYDWWVAKHRVIIQITMPREESQKDKENATEKDFREKIGIMEQLYRAVHEIRELNLMNQLMVKIFKRDTISFEIFAKHKEITFFCTVHPYYKDILEKQITSFYPTASIDYPGTFDLKAEKGEKRLTQKGYYLFTKNTNWLPIKAYKTIENDPLNDMTNVLSQLEQGEKAVVQVMIRPRDSKWQKEANEYANAKFKNKNPGERMAWNYF